MGVLRAVFWRCQVCQKTYLVAPTGPLVEGTRWQVDVHFRQECVVDVAQPVVFIGYKLIAFGVEELVLDRSGLIRIAGDGRVDALRHEQAGAEADDDEGNHPAHGGLQEHFLVDTLATLEQRDAGGCADLAVGRGEREAKVRAQDDDGCCAQFDREATRRRDDSKLHAYGTHDLIAVEEQTDADADAANGEDPVSVVANVRLL
eukprot:1031727-Pleurochrysis_carterae.AAC.1